MFLAAGGFIRAAVSTVCMFVFFRWRESRVFVESFEHDFVSAVLHFENVLARRA